MKLAVMAGTLLDTQMGVELLEKKGFSCCSCPISKTPQEQDALQFLSPKLLLKRVLSMIEDAKKEGAKALFLYCNSLSAALPLDRLEEEAGIPIISPFDAYRILGKQYENVILLAANSIAAQKVEQALKMAKENVSVLSLGYLDLVKSIESCSSPKEVCQKHALPFLFQFLNQLSAQKEQIVLLACTHFPYLKEEMQSLSLAPIVDPADSMIELLEERLQIKKEKELKLYKESF